MPQRTGAGELLVHRHLSALSQWDAMVIGPQDRAADAEFQDKIAIAPSRLYRWLSRFRRGVLWPAADRVLAQFLLSDFADAANGFSPDVVVSVFQSDNFLTTAALYARQRGLPLVLFCHDDYESFMPPAAQAGYSRIYRQASARLCVSQVMADEFARRYGVSGQVLPPIPGNAPQAARLQCDGDPLTIGFAGSVNQGYEQAMVCLADALSDCGGRLVVTSRTPRTIAPRIWTHPAVSDLGEVEPENLMAKLLGEGVNVLAVIQSFDAAERLIKFNFPSKLTEYMTFGLPILVAAPEYASASLWLQQEKDAAVLITRPQAEAFVEPLARLQRAGERLALANKMGEIAKRYDPRLLHDQFENALLAAIGSSRAAPAAAAAADLETA